MIEVRNLVFEYPGLRALDDVSFRVERGAITALVGPNGAGKTTLMRCITALERPMSGKVVIDGRDAHDDPRLTHEDMGYLSDFFGLYDELTVGQCLRYRAAAAGVAAGDVNQSAMRAASRMGLDDRIAQKAGTLSRGLRQRLAIAQAIIHEPRLVLLDEPASGLDPESRLALSRMLREMRDEGMTLIVSSHILAELEDYATDMLILREGRISGHRAAAGDGAEDGAALLTLRLAEPDARLGEVLRGLDDVAAPAVEGRSATLMAPRDPQAQHAILRALIEAGMKVCEFRGGQTRLRDAYMQHAASADAPAEDRPAEDRPGGDAP